jgi:hypothetical protein
LRIRIVKAEYNEPDPLGIQKNELHRLTIGVPTGDMEKATISARRKQLIGLFVGVLDRFGKKSSREKE